MSMYLSIKNLKNIVGDFVICDHHVDVGDFCIPKSQILAICNKTVYYWQYTIAGEVATVRNENGIAVYETTNGAKIYAFDPESICLTSVDTRRLSADDQTMPNTEQPAVAEAIVAAAVAATVTETVEAKPAEVADQPKDDDEFVDLADSIIDDDDEESDLISVESSEDETLDEAIDDEDDDSYEFDDFDSIEEDDEPTREVKTSDDVEDEEDDDEDFFDADDDAFDDDDEEFEI